MTTRPLGKTYRWKGISTFGGVPAITVSRARSAFMSACVPPAIDRKQHRSYAARRLSLAEKTIILGVSGGIAAYKSAELVRLLRKEDADVRVVMTRAAREFITPLTLQTLSGNPVMTDL